MGRRASIREEVKTHDYEKNIRAYLQFLGNAHYAIPPTKKKWKPKDARIRLIPWQQKKFHAYYAKTAEIEGHQRDTRVFIQPLGSILSHACHAKEMEPGAVRGMPGNTFNYLAVLRNPCLSREGGVRVVRLSIRVARKSESEYVRVVRVNK